jgi:hypothetical protein
MQAASATRPAGAQNAQEEDKLLFLPVEMGLFDDDILSF